ncbi:unnamed protein product [Lactuca virosa]|uniref:DUF4378 domain-containing protein n=1 Tax=Lactuca virosa TaxID=75947 RepID=A0AAU9MK06_9ASTR|nr:unnamed protein product [Lactuca virosa]
MAAKLLHSLADDNPDLQKQIGCMTGVFHIFDRHHIVPGRRFPGHSPKRFPPGSPQFDNGTTESESSNSYQRPYISEKHSNKTVQDKHRASTESSRDSFSSMSRSSSFSSIDCNINRTTTTHQEPDQIVFPETPSRDTPRPQSCGSRQSVDLRDVVKDSMYRSQTPEHNYREFQEPNWYYNEPRELSRSKSYQFRDGSSYPVPKDCPRFSYDGRETNRLLFQSKTMNSNSKQVEDLPRLSLDSRESSTRSLNTVSRNPTPSVVAKLMGLDTLPDSGSGSGSGSTKELGLGPIRTTPVESLKGSDHFGPIKMQNFSRNTLKEPTSPLWKNADMKPSSRFPMEPAPWKQRDGGARSPQRPGSRVMKSPTKIQSPYSSVYGEVDKRLKDLQFTQSGKDLRALKQILEAMQSMESRKEGNQSMESRKEGTQVMVKRHSVSNSTQNERFSDRGRSHSHQNPYDSPIVIMKPGKLVERSGMHVAEFPISIPKTTRRENGGGRHTITNTKTPTKQQNLVKENATNSGKISGSISPRLQQKRAELERRSRPPTPPVADSGKLKKQLTRQLSDTTSPGGRRRPKYSNIQQSDDQYHGQMSQEVVNTPEFSQQIDNMQSPSSIQEKSSLIQREDESHDPEYPSPVSVLDDAVYMDDSPSPVKHMLKTLKDDATTQAPNEKFMKNKWEQQPDNNTLPDIICSSEILLASGLLLRDLKTFQFHSSGHPINPELFLVLEQTKFSNLPKDNCTPEKLLKKEKLHRKLIFDTVNEVLTGKFGLLVPCASFKIVKKTLNAQKLLRDLCLEIEELQVRKKREDVSLEEEDDGFKSIMWEEVLNKAESWTDYDGELPVIALEVERLIFKDLVNEVVLGEAADGRRIKPGRRCRQLFSK